MGGSYTDRGRSLAIDSHDNIGKDLKNTLIDFRFVEEGMNKEQVELLYGIPNLISLKESEMNYSATEKWVYKWNPGEIRIFFKDDFVVALESKRTMPIVP